MAYRPGPTSFPQARTQQMWENRTAECAFGRLSDLNETGYLMSNFARTTD